MKELADEKNSFMSLGTCFARAFHSKVETFKIFDDYIASEILSEEEKQYFFGSFCRSRQCYFSNFKGNDIDSIRLVINSKILGDVLSRSKLCEEIISQEVRGGVKKYLNIGAGYDTFAYRCNYSELSVCEIDIDTVINDKNKRFGLKSI